MVQLIIVLCYEHRKRGQILFSLSVFEENVGGSSDFSVFREQS